MNAAVARANQLLAYVSAGPSNPHDWDFMAETRQLVPALLTYIKELEDKLQSIHPEPEQLELPGLGRDSKGN